MKDRLSAADIIVGALNRPPAEIAKLASLAVMDSARVKPCGSLASYSRIRPSA